MFAALLLLSAVSLLITPSHATESDFTTRMQEAYSQAQANHQADLLALYEQYRQEMLTALPNMSATEARTAMTTLQTMRASSQQQIAEQTFNPTWATAIEPAAGE